MRAGSFLSLSRIFPIVISFALTPAAFAIDGDLPAGSHVMANSPCANTGEISSAAKSALREFDAIVVGETHGTNELPRSFLAFVCQALAVGKDIHVGLEYPQDAVDAARDARFVGDGPAAKGVLARSDFWRLSRDGRSSASSAKMLWHLLDLEASGLITVVGFDLRATGSDHFGDKASDSLLDVFALHVIRPRIFILLTGHGHAAFSSGRNSLSNSLEKRGLKVLQVEYTHSGGTAWVCTSGKCGETQMPARGACSNIGTVEFEIKSLGLNRAYANYCVGNISYSPPELENWSR